MRTETFENEYVKLCQRLPAEEFCNLAITLIIQTEYLLDKLLAAQQRRFLENGGIREAMSAARRDFRSRNNPNNWSNQNNQNNRNNQSSQSRSNNSNNSNSSNNSNNSNNPNNPNNSNSSNNPNS